MKFRNLIIVLYLLQIGFSLFMKYLSYIGDDSPELHSLILKYFTEEDIQSGIEYSRRGFYASILSQLIDFVFAGIFVFTSISVKIENYLMNKTKNKFYASVVLFIIIYYGLEFIISLPFNYYFGFVLEHKFGFSKMTFLDWIVYTGKSLLVGAIIGIIIGLGAVYILKKFQKTWKFIIPIASFIFGMIFSVIFPILITPIFYDYRPISEGSLKDKIISLCKYSNISVENVYVIDESRYSGHTNAYFTGWGNNRKIFIYDTLIKNHTEDEVVSVLGHEIGHWIHNHELIGNAASSAGLLILSFLLAFIFEKTKSEGLISLNEFYSPSSLPFIFLVSSIIFSFTNPFSSSISRMMEREADMEALILTNDKKSFIDTEIKMAKDNKSRLNSHPWIVFYYHSHPTTLERIKMAEDYKK